MGLTTASGPGPQPAPALVPAPLPPLKIGGLTLGFPVVQAALSGYSDAPMRVISRRHGASYGICEVMLDQFLVALKERQKTKHFLHIDPSEHPVGGQLMGAEPVQFAAGAVRLVQAGFDVIDINFGCPVKKVLGRCRGGFHLGQPKVALEIVERTREVVPPQIPVTLKMRRGLDDTPRSRDLFYEILDGAFERGVAAITVHGRTVAQRYVGPSRWEFLREVKQHVGARTILGSGDLFTAEDCLRMLRETGVDGVTVARGSIGNPWIFREAAALARGEPLPPPPTVAEQAACLRDHFGRAEALYGERCAPLMRKFAIKYAARHPLAERVRERFIRAGSAAEWEAVLREWYDAPEHAEAAGVVPGRADDLGEC